VAVEYSGVRNSTRLNSMSEFRLYGRPSGHYSIFGITSQLQLANVGNSSRVMRKDGEVLERGVFDLGARRKPQVFAADAVSRWRFNQN
jgi:hypothetical protein